MAFFRDEESSIHYLERGRGEPLLLIHGLGCSGAAWAFQVAALEHRFRLIIPDLPGSGHSAPPRSEYTIAGFANAMWRLMDHLNIRKTNIVGFSLGGAVALEMASIRPSCVPKLGLINSLATYQPHACANGSKPTFPRRWCECWACRARPVSWPRGCFRSRGSGPCVSMPHGSWDRFPRTPTWGPDLRWRAGQSWIAWIA